ncbi:MAG: FAD-binding oxidoreductase [Chloroflexi bacterium]|nr:FAD-binding oxidoreductase [Chloroflexota bacterium]
MSPFNSVNDMILEQLAAVVSPDNLSTTQADRQLHAQDMSNHPAHLSEVVVWPTTARQVADVLRIANEQRVPVTAWGAGSSLEGNPIPLFGGIVLSTERMIDIVEVRPEDFQITVQPGIGYKDLNEKLVRYGLFFPPDPGANAAIGGMLGNNAAGSRTVKYGATKDNVLAMEVALTDGQLIRVGSHAIKQSAGYDLLHLFIGSEGTLGIITEATLQLTPVPTVMTSVFAAFPSVESAVAAVVEVRSSGLDVAALEFMDEKMADLISREGGADWGDQPALLMEVHAAHEETAALDMALIREICEELGALQFDATTDPAKRKIMWQARHHVFETQVRAFPGQRWQVLDIAVPISAFPALVSHASQTLQVYDMFGLMIGHAGDGNLHVSMPYKDEGTWQRALKINDSIVYKAIELGGTSTGEHGVGIGKAKFMAPEHGAALEVMRSLKQTLDPNGILNPGKIFPTGT